MASPLDVPRRPRWRDQEVNMAGIRVRPSTYNQTDRARIDKRLSISLDDKDTDPSDDDQSP